MPYAVSYEVIRSGRLCPACVGSSIDSRVVRCSSGLVLGVKNHICGDTVCVAIYTYILITLYCIVKHKLECGTYQQ